MSRTVTIAVAQTIPVSQELEPPSDQMDTRGAFWAIDQNLLDTMRQVEEAATRKADVVHFPEFWLQDLVGQGRQHLAYPHAHIVSFLQVVAKKYKIAIVGSIACGQPSSPETSMPAESPFVHLLGGPPPKALTDAQQSWAEWVQHHLVDVEAKVGHARYPQIHNTSVFIDDEGQVLGEYAKQNLWHPERDYFVQGRRQNQVFETKFGRVGLLICWDISHPSAGQELSDQGVDIVFVSAYWLATDSHPQLNNWRHVNDYEKTVVHSWMLARAIETESVWSLCNCGGDPMSGYMGGSGVWVPLRGNIGGIPGPGAGLRIMEIDMNVLQDTQKVYKIRDDYARYLKMVEAKEANGTK